MRVLVTGGGGFIGSHVVDRLLDKWHDAADLRPQRLARTTHRWKSRLSPAAITDPANLDLSMRDCDAVIHLAAVADVGHVHADPVLAEEVNTRGTLNVLEAACRAKVDRVVYGSTTWVYSDCPEQEVDEETPIPAPRHLYTATKLAGETYCSGYAELYDLQSTVLRFGIPYGPARPRRRGGRQVHRPRVRGQGPDDRRRRLHHPQLHLRRGPRRRDRRGARRRRRPGAPTTSPATKSSRSSKSPSGSRKTPTTARSSTRRRAPAIFRARRSPIERALAELGWKAETSFQRRRPPVRRMGALARPGRRTRSPASGRALNGNQHAAGALLSGAARFEERPPKVLVLSADIGEGHDLPARIIKADLEAEMPERRGRDRQRPRGDGEGCSRRSSAAARSFTFRCARPGSSTCSTG